MAKSEYVIKKWKVFILDISNNIVNSTDIFNLTSLADIFGIKYKEDMWGGIIREGEIKTQVAENLYEVLYGFWKDQEKTKGG